MAKYTLPSLSKPVRAGSRQVLLVASGDLRETANRVCWPAQEAMEAQLAKALKGAGYTLIRAHPFKKERGHGFISSQKEGMEVFAKIDPDAKLIVAEAVWQYSHHVLSGLVGHRGPILTVANWSGQWPGLVGMLNLNGSLTKEGVKYNTLWSEDFASKVFAAKLGSWLKTGRVKHDLSHVRAFKASKAPVAERRLGQALAAEIKQQRAIMGVFDEGCMGMFNAIIPDELLHPTGVFKERLSQSALFAGAMRVSDDEAGACLEWFRDMGMTFHFGPNEDTDLTERQVLLQCKTYVAAVRLAEEFGCDCIGIQYQQGLKDLLPASDLVEGALNNAERPPVRSLVTGKVIRPGMPIPHFNEVDECAGLDALMTNRVHRAMKQPLETTLHDLRWGDPDASGTTKEYVWVFEISGAVPPAHFKEGWADAIGERQPAMYFRLGGSTIKGISKPGEIVWSRIFVDDSGLNMDLGRATVVQLPFEETQRRWNATTAQWPIMHAVTHGVSRDQMMARHKANHLNVVYARDAASADRSLMAKAAMAEAMGMKVFLCGV